MEVYLAGYGNADINVIPSRLKVFGEETVWLPSEKERAVAVRVAIENLFAADSAAEKVRVTWRYHNGAYLHVMNWSPNISDDEFKTSGKLVDTFWVAGRHGVETQYLRYSLERDGTVYLRTFEGSFDRERDL